MTLSKYEYYRTENGVLYHGDCLEIMPHLEPVDLVLTSPPYDKLRDYGGYVFDFSAISANLFNLVLCGGCVVWIVKDGTENGSESGTSFKQALGFMDLGFRLYDTMIYKKNGVNYPTPNRYYDVFEYMFIFSKGKPKTINLICDRINTYAGDFCVSGTCRQKDGSKNLRSDSFKNKVKNRGIRWNVWEYPTGYNLSSKEKIAFEHPAIFPENLAQDHIVSWTNEEEIVLDPMCGSGTTLKLSEKLNRRWIGIEIEEKYCAIAKQRIENERKQRKLF